MLSRLRLLVVTAVTIVGISAGHAFASPMFGFSYSYSGVSASGIFTTTDNLNGSFTVTDISGERNGVAIDTLLPIGSGGVTDNLLFPADAVVVNFPGISFSLADGTDINLYASNVFPGTVREYVNFFDELPTDGGFLVAITRLADSSDVPEPLTLSLFAAGLVGVGSLRMRSRK